MSYFARYQIHVQFIAKVNESRLDSAQVAGAVEYDAHEEPPGFSVVELLSLSNVCTMLV
jgi:hypothetical protein